MDSSGTEGRLRAHVEALAGTIGERHFLRPRALAAAADYIDAAWRAQGYVPERETFTVNGVNCANLVITRPGRLDELLLIGAHYDTVRGSPGADDNASGVAGLLELSRAFTAVAPSSPCASSPSPTRSRPSSSPSSRAASCTPRPPGRAASGSLLMVSLEMLGYYDDRPGSQRYPPLFRWFYPDRGDFLGFVGDLRSRGLMQRAAAAFRAASELPLETCATFRWIPGVGWSDHAPFWRQGYRAFMVTDTAFHRNPYYHTAGDVPRTLDYGRFAAAVNGLSATVMVLATSDCRA